MHCVEVASRGLALTELEPGDCRFPYGDKFITFCGQPKREKSSYCDFHHEICWTRARNQLERAA